MEIKSLDNISIDNIYKAFSLAFADYELQLNKTQLMAMLQRRGFKADLSFAAFEADKILAFTLNGIGNFNGIATAYDTGTGTLKDYRGQGLATKIFEYSIPYLKKAGIEQYLLEVLQHNTKAVSIYKKLGFNVSREFDYSIQKNDLIQIKKSHPDIRIKTIDMESIKSLSNFWDFPPSWQNSIESIERSKDGFKILGAYLKEELKGYCVFEPSSGDLTQIAVEQEFRKQGVASRLLQRCIELNTAENIKLINTDISCSSIKDFLISCNIPNIGQQYEMIRKI